MVHTILQQRILDGILRPGERIDLDEAKAGVLRQRFGNLGTAAAAYNAGEGRVANWLHGQGGLPAETRAYVPKLLAMRRALSTKMTACSAANSPLAVNSNRANQRANIRRSRP